MICNRCRQEGHWSKDCQNEIVCRECGQRGHKQEECPRDLRSDIEDVAGSVEKRSDTIIGLNNTEIKPPATSNVEAIADNADVDREPFSSSDEGEGEKATLVTKETTPPVKNKVGSSLDESDG